MKNIFKLYFRLLNFNLSEGELSSSIETKKELSVEEARKFVEENKEFAEFYENSDTAKLSASNRLHYKEYKEALYIINPQEKINSVELSNSFIKKAARYNSKMPEYYVQHANELFGLENNGSISEELIKNVVVFQRENGLVDDGMIGSKTFVKIDEALKLKEVKKPANSIESQTKIGIENIKTSFESKTSRIVEKQQSGLDLSKDEVDVLDAAVLLAERQLKNLEDTNKEYLSQKQPQIEQTKGEIALVKDILKKEYVDVRTQEKISEGNSDVLFGLIKNGKFDTSGFYDNLDASSKISLQNILSNSNLKDIYNSLEALAPKDGNYHTFTNYIVASNYGDYAHKLKELGYKKDGATLDDKEACAVLMILSDYVYNQENVKNLTTNQQFEMLIDFDRSGILDTERNFVFGELQTLNASLDKKSDGIDALMSNLGLGSMSEFSKEMSQNLFNAREKFQRILGSMGNQRIALVELAQEGGVEKAYREVLSDEHKVTQEVDNCIENSKKLDNKLKALSLNEAQIDEIKKVIKLEAVGAVLNGDKLGTGAAFDISGYTDGIIDSLGIGVYDGTPGIAISTDIYTGENASVTFGLANLVIPILGGNYRFDQARAENLGLFIKDVKKQATPSVYGAVAVGGGFAGVEFKKSEELTKVGIDDMVKDLDKSLSLIKQDILDGKSFSESDFYEKSVDKETDLAVYNELKSVFDRYSSSVKPEALADIMFKGYKDYYRNKLYQNAEGIHFSSVGAGVALVAGYLPLPYLTLSMDKLGLDYKTINDRIESQRDTTRELVSINSSTLRYESLDGKNVYSILEDDEMNIEFSSPTGEVEVSRQNGKVYFSGKNLETITFVRHFDQEKKSLQVIINGGSKEKDATFKIAKEQPLITSLKEDTLNNQVLDYGRITELNKENLEKTESIRNDVFNILSHDALPDKNTPGVTKLQDMVVNMSKNEGVTLDQAWNQLEDVFNNNKIDKYSEKRGSTASLSALREKLRFNLSDGEKLLILQSIPACLMKRDALQIIAGEVNVGKTIAAYDQRAKYFDKIFTKETPDILRDIHSARNKWFESNGNESRYEFKQVTDGSIVFSGTEVKKDGRDTLMPYIGAYNIAEANISKVSIEKKSDDLIDLLPKQYLELIRESLTSQGYVIENNETLVNMLKGEKIDGVGVDYDLSFVKMGECLNDAIVLDNIRLVNITANELSSSANVGINTATTIGFALSDKPEKKNKGDGETTTGGGDADSNPGVDEGDTTDDSGGSTGPGDFDSNPGIDVGNTLTESNGSAQSGNFL